MAKLCVVNVVGLTPGMIGEDTPYLRKIGGVVRGMKGVLPAVTTTAQASLLTGKTAAGHGIVGNGWLFRETGEVRFWLQSNRLMDGEPLYVTARKMAEERGEKFTCAKLFWWYNQGAAVDFSVTPKPHYGADGSKQFGIHGTPDDLPVRLEQKLGAFPFHTFWGPMAGLPCSEWIALAAAEVLRVEQPTLTLVYLPHLDYDLQRFGPTAEVVKRCVREVDRAVGVVTEAAEKVGAVVAVVSEYGLTEVNRPVYVNRVLRKAGWLSVRSGPFGEVMDTFNCRALAVTDHQVAHVYIPNADDIAPVAELLKATPGVAEVLDREAQAEYGLNHARSGELVLFSEREAWFAYPYWLDDRLAPDFARTVDIHRKPGYDPCELFLDPKLSFPKLRLARRLAAKKLGFRYLMDVIPLDASLVRGSHGLPAKDEQSGPVFLSNDDTPPPQSITDFKAWALQVLGKG